MQFGKDHKVILETLNSVEAQCYIQFLMLEIGRHKRAIEHAEASINILSIVNSEPAGIYIRLWESAVLRHKQDITSAKKLIRQVKQRFR